MKLLQVLLGIACFLLLTIFTQIGGIVFLLSLLLLKLLDKKIKAIWARFALGIVSFLALYLLFTFLLVPFTAKRLGRAPLPLFEKNNLKPANIWTCLLNRHYVRPELKKVAYSVAKKMNEDFPGAKVIYLDANFPFINKFPLFPHLSHNDGKKLDIAFEYNDKQTGQIANSTPSVIGYGICEEPQDGEENKPEECEQQGYWQYNLLRDVVSQENKDKFQLDHQRTAKLVNDFAVHEEIGKIFIEPHLKQRLGLTNEKVRYHGCQAVRHDDHIHVQLK